MTQQGVPSDDFVVHISPKPASDDEEAILAAVRETLRREAELARPPTWRLHGWVEQRVGVADLTRSIPSHRTWPLSARMPRGGRVFPGLNGRGDAK